MKTTKHWHMVCTIDHITFLLFNTWQLALHWVDWKWRTIKIAGHEIAGHEIGGPICRTWNCKTENYKTGNCRTWKCRTWKCRTWKWRTKNDDRAWNGMLNLYSVYSASNVHRLCALLCPAISFLHFHVLHFHVRHFHVLQFHILQVGPSF